MDPRCIASYTEDVVDLLVKHAVVSCTCTPTILSYTTAADLKTLTHCAIACRDAQTTSSPGVCRLQLNANKTSASGRYLGRIWSVCAAKLSKQDYSIRIGASTIQPSTVVHDLGVHLDSELSMKQHVA